MFSPSLPIGGDAVFPLGHRIPLVVPVLVSTDASFHHFSVDLWKLTYTDGREKSFSVRLFHLREEARSSPASPNDSVAHIHSDEA